MKRLAFSIIVVLVLAFPAYTSAKDAGPISASAAAPASAPTSLPAKASMKIEGKVEVPATKDVKVTPNPPSDGKGLFELVYGIYENFKTGKVWDGISLLLMLMTFIIGIIRKDIPAKYLPWIAAVIGIATNIVSAIIGGVEWDRAVFSGLFQGAAAAGLWSMVGKYILRSKDELTKRMLAREIVAGKSTSGSIEEK